MMIPLHVHSNYTLLQGTARIEELVEKAKENKLGSLALTDTNHQYFSIGDGVEFQRKTIAMTAKGTGNAYVIPDNFSSGTSILFDTDGDIWFGIFINGNWKTVTTDATVA